MRIVQHLPCQGLLMNDTVIVHKVRKSKVSVAESNKSSTHTANHWGSISCNCHQFVNGYVIIADILFKFVVTILTPRSLLQMQNTEEILL